MSEPSWVDVDALRSQVPGFEGSAQYIRSMLDPLRDGPGGMEGGTYIYGDDDNGTKFYAVFAKSANEIETLTRTWSDSIDYTGGGVKNMAVNYDSTEDNNVRTARFDPDGGKKPPSNPGSGGSPYGYTTDGTPLADPDGTKLIPRSGTLESTTDSVPPIDDGPGGKPALNLRQDEAPAGALATELSPRLGTSLQPTTDSVPPIDPLGLTTELSPRLPRESLQPTTESVSPDSET